MINYADIRKDVREDLETYLKTEYATLNIIMSNPDAPEPPRPFVTMNYISAFIPGGNGAYEHEDDGDDLEETRTGHAEMICSINIYSDDHDEAHEIALMAQAWFSHLGTEKLRTAGAVVIDVMALQNRDVYVVDTWERRMGFDVSLRVVSETVKIITTIQTVDLGE